MRHVEIHAFIPNTPVLDVFDTLADFNHYAQLVDVVRSVEMERGEDGTATSSWIVDFRNGLLQWTEEDWFYRDELKMDFRQIDGDFDEFYGGWVMSAEAGGSRASLIVDFDFGVPSLASIVEPVAERVLTDVTQQILTCLFGEEVTFLANAPAPVAAAAG